MGKGGMREVSSWCDSVCMTSERRVARAREREREREGGGAAACDGEGGDEWVIVAAGDYGIGDNVVRCLLVHRGIHSTSRPMDS